MIDRYSAATKVHAAGRIPEEAAKVVDQRRSYRDALYTLQSTLDIGNGLLTDNLRDALLENLTEAERAYVLRETTDLPA